MTTTKGLALFLMLSLLCICGCDRATETVALQGSEDQKKETRLEELWVTNIAEAKSINAKLAQRFGPTDPIIANIRLSGDRPADLHVSLFYMRTGVKMGDEGHAVSSPGSNIDSFVFRPVSVWGGGRYLLEVKLDGRVVAHQEIEIVVEDKNIH